MGWVRVAPRSDLLRWDVPKEIVGKYLGAEQRQTKLGISTLHCIQNGSDPVSFFGTKVLDDLLSRVEPGIAVKIRYLGETPTRHGTQYKRFEVEIDIPDGTAAV